MKKTMKWIFISLLTIIVIVVLAGIFKFNYLSSKVGYDVDGNKIKQESKDTTKTETVE